LIPYQIKALPQLAIENKKEKTEEVAKLVADQSVTRLK
jgi:hypothetical protein